MSNLKEVDKALFDKFINEYPNKLETCVVGMCCPSPVAYHDFSIADGWDAIVATRCEELDDDYKPTGKWTYKIKG